MDSLIKKLFGKNPEDDRLARFGELFLEVYLRDGLGVMSKKETELLVVHLLEAGRCFEGPSNANHNLSLLLRVSESRIANLRYESRLRYPPQDPEEFAKIRLLSVLWFAEPLADGKTIQLVIEDRYVRQYLTALAKRRHSVIDTSFNREIVDMHPDQLVAVITEAYGEPVGLLFKTAFKKTMDDQHKFTFAQAKKEFLSGLAKGTGSSIPSAIKAAAATALAGGAA